MRSRYQFTDKHPNSSLYQFPFQLVNMWMEVREEQLFVPSITSLFHPYSFLTSHPSKTTELVLMERTLLLNYMLGDYYE